jgi:hypothetical protein
MRNKTFIYALIVALLGIIAVPRMGRSKGMECSYPVSRMITDKLNQGIGLIELLRYLHENEIRFLAFAQNEQRVEIFGLNKQDIGRFGEITITVVSRNREKRKLVSEGELMKIRFNKNHRLASSECKKFYTGP